MLEKIDNLIKKIIELTIIITGMGIVLCVILQILSRYIMDSPLIFTEEYSRLFFCWFSFIGCILGSRTDSHLEVSYFYDKFPKKMQKIVSIIVKLSMTIFCFVLSFYSFEQTISQQGVLSSATRTPLAIFTISLLISSFFMGFYNLLHTICLFKGKEGYVNG